MSKSIFISIASYCDELLLFTIKRALATAKNPQSLHFGVVDQNIDNSCISYTDVLPAKLSYIHLDAVYARGPCWARSLVMSLYNNEDYFLQIDAHTDFCQNWDEYFIDQADLVKSIYNTDRYVLSSFPQSFTYKDGKTEHCAIHPNPFVSIVVPNSSFHPVKYTLPFESRVSASSSTVKGWHLVAGCLFAPGNIVYDIPYDPYYYFYGEEQSYSIRLYTKGWDIFHIPKVPIYHQYNRVLDSGAMLRPVHWNNEIESNRITKWYTLEEISQQRLRSLFTGKDLGIYGLGKLRTLNDFKELSGIDYLNKQLLPKAHQADR